VHPGISVVPSRLMILASVYRVSAFVGALSQGNDALMAKTI